MKIAPLPAPPTSATHAAAIQSEIADLSDGEQSALHALLALAEPARPAESQRPQTAADPALYTAAGEGDLAQVQSLIAAGRNVDETERTTRYTPLHIAARRGHLPIVEALLDAGANPTLRTALGQTTVNCANASRNRDVINRIKHALQSWPG